MRHWGLSVYTQTLVFGDVEGVVFIEVSSIQWVLIPQSIAVHVLACITVYDVHNHMV